MVIVVGLFGGMCGFKLVEVGGVGRGIGEGLWMGRGRDGVGS